MFPRSGQPRCRASTDRAAERRVARGVQAHARLGSGGFGKTTLLSEWIAARDLQARVAWVSLDESDNDPARFMAYMTAALQKVEATLGQDT